MRAPPLLWHLHLLPRPGRRRMVARVPCSGQAGMLGGQLLSTTPLPSGPTAATRPFSVLSPESQGALWVVVTIPQLTDRVDQGTTHPSLSLPAHRQHPWEPCGH